MKNIKKLTTGAITAAGSLLATAESVLAEGDPTNKNPAGLNVSVPDTFIGDSNELINTLLNFVLSIAGILVFAYLIWGGIEWITSGGDSGKTEKARNKITAAVVGLIILVAAYAIFQLVTNLLGINFGIFGTEAANSGA